MGIRFFCPNGHRLNVKSFLAGKRGVCPDCGTRVDIPMESDARATSSKSRNQTVGQEIGAISGRENASATAVLERPVDSATPRDNFDLPVGLPTAAAPVDPAEASVPAKPVVRTNSPAVTTTMASPVAVPVAPVAAPAATSDPLMEAPNAVWYVLPPNGKQYGPARGEVMRKWLTEGRVTPESLVWREGWADWLPATKVFEAMLATAPVVASPVPIVVSEAPRRVIRPARKSSTASGIAIVVTLGLVCIGLFVALVFVLMNSGQTPATP